MMTRNPQSFVVLADVADALMAFRKSCLMDAASFRVGTRFSIAFLPFSIVRLP